MAPSAGTARLDLLASALCGRDIKVAHTPPGEPAWTDGAVIFVDSAGGFPAQVQQVCVQSALLAAGSLDRRLVRRLKRQPQVARRYLAIEGHRALAALRELLPPLLQPHLELALAARSDSPAASLELALNRQLVAEPPLIFGTIRARELLARQQAAAGTPASETHVPRRQSAQLAELPDQAGADDEDGEDASSPVGGGGGLGRLLQKLLQAVRQLRDRGAPGADAPTHWARTRPRAGVASLSTAARPEEIAAAFGDRRGTLYPEWDVRRHCYRPDWCTVREFEAPADRPSTVAWLDGPGLRRPLARLGLGLERVHRRAQGDDIDIDAAIEAQVERISGASPGEAIYIDSRRRRRDLSVLILLDISGSATQTSPAGGNVHEQQRRLAAALGTVLYEIGDRFALYAYHSQGRSAVHLVPVKRFEEQLDSQVMRRLHSLVPGAYSRLGAAIRHGASRLIERGGTPRRLLLVLSDGLAYDHGYDPVHGAADARRALAEARRDGVGCLCLSVGASTDTESLRKVFGSAAHARIPAADQVGRHIGPLFRSALRSGEARRRVATAASTRKSSRGSEA